VTPAVETTGLTKYYGTTRGIEDLDLRVDEGEFGYLGPNGAGKTTTIRLLLDLIRPTRGGARIAGHDTWTESLEIRRLVLHASVLPSTTRAVCTGCASRALG
jgi:ABC-2 type transport system ATP-binding protein